MRDRRQLEPGVAVELRLGASGSHHHNRPEVLVLASADQDLDGPIAGVHLLDDVLTLAEATYHLHVGVFESCGIAEAEGDRPEFGLVCRPRGLEHERRCQVRAGHHLGEFGSATQRQRPRHRHPGRADRVPGRTVPGPPGCDRTRPFQSLGDAPGMRGVEPGSGDDAHDRFDRGVDGYRVLPQGSDGL